MNTSPQMIRVSGADWLSILPEVVVISFVLVMLLLDALWKKSRPVTQWLGFLGAIGGLVAVFATWGARGGGSRLAFYGMIVHDPFGLFMKGIILIGAAVSILMSIGYVRREELDHGEYYALILLASVGMMLMSASADLIMIFLTFELFSISLYILSAFARTRPKSEEAGMKYLLLGAFSSAFLLYGVALVYGSTGTTNLPRIADILATPLVRSNSLLLAGMGLLLVGLGFKVSAVPFQVWTPDVYEGAPTPVSAFMSVGTKVAAFAAIVRVFLDAMINLRVEWLPVVWALAALTMIVGNVIAIAQPNIKRMLAYSSIGHAGYILVAVAAANRASLASIPFYLLAYAFVNLGAWGVAIAVSRRGEMGMDLQDYSGLFWRNPGMAAAMALFMFGLAGIPPTAGFTAKAYVFIASLDARLVGLAVLIAVTTAISVYYYLRVIVLMFMNKPEGELPPITVPATMTAAIIIAVIGTLLLGVYPGPLFELAQRVVRLGF